MYCSTVWEILMFYGVSFVSLFLQEKDTFGFDLKKNAIKQWGHIVQNVWGIF